MRRIALGIAAMLAAAAGMVTTASDAQAARTDCTISGVCLWEHRDYNGVRTDLANQNSGSPFTYNLWFYDNTSSWRNTMGNRDAKWFSELNGLGWWGCMQSNASAAQISWSGNDQVSSVIIYTDTRAC